MKIFPATIESYGSRADRSLKIVLGSQEAAPDLSAYCQQHMNKLMIIAVNESPFTEQEKADIESLKADYTDTGKTHSQRLRGVLYRLWEQDNAGYTDFHDFYMVRMERLINQIKDRLI